MIMGKNYFFLIVLLIVMSCTKMDLIDPAGYGLTIESDTVVFAVIGDFGYESIPAERVSKLVDSWDPDFIITTGDNNYEEGKMKDMHKNIGQYYGKYIYNYDAPNELKCTGEAYNMGVNRFFPCPGNHDANNRDGLTPYFNYFTLPERESYYKFSWGPVTCYSLNSLEENMLEQEVWLERQLIKSTTPFNIVYTHFAPYSCGSHGNHEKTQFNYYGLGVDMVFSGHDHIYSRIQKTWEDGLYYIISGCGGKNLHACDVNPLPEDLFSSYCYNSDYGAVKVIVTSDLLTMEFYTLCSPDEPLDRVVIEK